MTEPASGGDSPGVPVAAAQRRDHAPGCSTNVCGYPQNGACLPGECRQAGVDPFGKPLAPPAATWSEEDVERAAKAMWATRCGDVPVWGHPLWSVEQDAVRDEARAALSALTPHDKVEWPENFTVPAPHLIATYGVDTEGRLHFADGSLLMACGRCGSQAYPDWHVPDAEWDAGCHGHNALCHPCFDLLALFSAAPDKVRVHPVEGRCPECSEAREMLRECRDRLARTDPFAEDPPPVTLLARIDALLTQGGEA